MPTPESTTAPTGQTGAEALLAALTELGVRYIFANLGTDYPAIVEALARSKRVGGATPDVIICPHETVAAAAAQGYAYVTRRPQAVFVHVDVGTANLGGAVHNIARSRTPMLIFAGQSPWTTRGELQGSRTSPIQFAQDVPDQAGIVRQYVKWAYEVKTPANISQAVHRAFQVACAEPTGPVYMMAAREPLAATVGVATSPVKPIAPPVPTRPDDTHLAPVVEWLNAAERPLIVTSYLGRNPQAVPALVALAERWAAPVCEVSLPYHLNFPRDHDLHLGVNQNHALPEADLILAIDTDTPWLPAVVRPRADARVVHIDIDPIKASMPMPDIPADLTFVGDAELILRRLVALAPAPTNAESENRVASRRAWARGHRDRHLHRLAEQAQPVNGLITPAGLADALGQALPTGAILLDETVSNTGVTIPLTKLRDPGSYFSMGGSSLGWGLGAALGAKLAAPDRDIVLAVGDGAFIFGAPSAAFWAARRYSLPFLTVIFNNVGWGAVKNATLDQYPEGFAAQSRDFSASFAPAGDLGQIAAAFGAWRERVADPADLDAAIRLGLAETRRGRAAVIEVGLVPI